MKENTIDKSDYQKMFNIYFKSSDEVIFFLDKNCKIIRVNPTISTILGYSIEEVIGREISDFFSEEHKKYLKPFCEKIPLEDFLHLEIEFIKKDSSSIYFESMCSKILDSEGQIKFHIFRNKDVSKEKSVRLALSSAKHFSDSILDTVDALIVVFDVEGKIIRFNKFCEALTNYKFEELEGKVMWNLLVPPEEIEGVIEVFSNLKEKVIPNRYINNWLTKDGEKKLISWSNTTIQDDKGNVKYIISTGIDITEQSRMDKDLQLKAYLLDSASDSIIVHDYEGHIFYGNKLVKEELGLEEDEIKGKNVFELTPHTDPEIRKNILDRVRTKKEVTFESEQKIRGLRSKFFERHSKEIEIDKEEHIITVSRDITARKELEQELKNEKDISQKLTEISSSLLSPTSIEDISDMILNYAKKLTESQIGFVSLIDPETGFAIVHTLTKDIYDECYVGNKDIVFDKFGGLWGWVLDNRKSLYTNNPSEHKHSSGTPEGHIKINNFLSVPAVKGDKLIGQIALANSLREYNEEDIKVIKRIADIYALAVDRNNTINALEAGENKLRESQHALQERLKELTSMYGITNALHKSSTSIEETILKTLAFIPPAMQYPEITSARLKLKQEEYSSTRFEISPWKLSSSIIVEDEIYGDFEIYYNEERKVENEGPFLSEERDLIEAISREIGRYFERKRIENYLAKEKEFVDSIIDSSNSLIYGFDDEYSTILFNSQMEKLTRTKREDVIGNNWQVMNFPESAKEQVKFAIKEFREKGVASYISKSGPPSRERDILWHLTKMKREEKDFFVFLGVDITEQTESAALIEELNESLRLINDILRHDLNNHLVVLDGAVESYIKSNEGAFLEMFRDAIQKSYELIQRMQELEETISYQEKLQEIDVRKIIEKVTLSYSFSDINFKIIGNGFVFADGALSSVVDNLINNAIKHGKANDIVITVTPNENFTIIQIADNGVGIQDEYKKDIFKQGFKFGEEAGSGLGLYIVQKTIERYKGEIVVKDNQPKGTVFELKIRR